MGPVGLDNGPVEIENRKSMVADLEQTKTHAARELQNKNINRSIVTDVFVMSMAYQSCD